MDYLPNLVVRRNSHRRRAGIRGPRAHDSELRGIYNRHLSLLKAKCISPDTQSIVEGGLASCIEASQRPCKDDRYYFLKKAAGDATQLAQRQLRRDRKQQDEREQVQMLRFRQLLKRYGPYGKYSDVALNNLVAHVDRKLQAGFGGTRTSWQEVYDCIVDEEIDGWDGIRSAKCSQCLQASDRGPYRKPLAKLSNHLHHLSKHCMLSWDDTKLAMMEFITGKDVSLQELSLTRSFTSLARILVQDQTDFKNIIPPAYRHLETELRSGLYNFERTYFQSITAEKNWRTGRMEVIHYQCNLPTQLMEQVQASVNNYGKAMQASVDDYRRSIDTFVRYRELLLNYTPGGIATYFQTPRRIVV